MKLRKLVLPILLASMCCMTGCDQTGPVKNTAKASQMVPMSESERAFSQKLGLYVEAYHVLMNGRYSIRPTYDALNQLLIASASSAAMPENQQGLEKGLSYFRQGLAIAGGGMPELDEKVSRAISAGERLSADEHALTPYSQAKKYQDGRYAKIRDPYLKVQSDYHEMFEVLDEIESLLFKYARAQSERLMVTYRKQGNWLNYYTEESLLNALSLCYLFSESEDSLRASERYAKADDMIAQLEKSLANQRKAIDDVRSQDSDNNIQDYLNINRILTSFIGNYRDLKQHRAMSDYQALYRRYTDALLISQKSSGFNYEPLP